MQCNRLDIYILMSIQVIVRLQALMGMHGVTPVGQDPPLQGNDLFRVIFNLGPPFHWKTTFLG